MIDFPEFATMMEKRIRRERHRSRKDSESQKAEDIRSMFAAFDKDNSGYIDGSELKATMKQLGMELTDKDVKHMLKEAGVNHGRIYYEGG